MDQVRYRRFVEQVTEWAQTAPEVIGLVVLGSAASRSHSPDEWSDHDLWVVTVPGGAETLRADQSWLPDAKRIVGWFLETVHGRSAVYDDGHLVEVAVFEDGELEIARANDFRVLYDAGGIAERIEVIAERTRREAPLPNHAAEAAAGRFVVEMIIGLGRLGRGELLSASELIRGRAVTSLLRAVAATSPQPVVLDNLDPHRRFELAFPSLASRITEALEMPLIEAAASLVDIAGTLSGLFDETILEVLRARVQQAR
jgi:lincosamide nucleotidyltransferase B/F